MKILVTGTAGFIGFHVADRLIREGVPVAGVDHFGPRFFPGLKHDRAADLKARTGFEPHAADIADLAALSDVFEAEKPTHVIHLAAQAGVRYSLVDPFLYQRSNVQGTLNILELSRRHGVERVLYASSSSVYGDAGEVPRKETDPVDTPVSLYAATKRATELMAGVYALRHGLVSVGMRFFTVYGPWGRPDMAVWKFAEKIAGGEPVPMYNAGDMRRDFTHVDDVVEGIRRLLDLPVNGHEVFNLGGGRREELVRLVELLETTLGRPANRVSMPMQAGDVSATWCDPGKLRARAGWAPVVELSQGAPAFARWYAGHPEVTDRVRRERKEGGEG